MKASLAVAALRNAIAGRPVTVVIHPAGRHINTTSCSVTA
jgi:hypothetical protein